MRNLGNGLRHVFRPFYMIEEQWRSSDVIFSVGVARGKAAHGGEFARRIQK